MLNQNEKGLQGGEASERWVFIENLVVMSEGDFEVCWQGTDLKEHQEFASVSQSSENFVAKEFCGTSPISLRKKYLVYREKCLLQLTMVVVEKIQCLLKW